MRALLVLYVRQNRKRILVNVSKVSGKTRSDRLTQRRLHELKSLSRVFMNLYEGETAGKQQKVPEAELVTQSVCLLQSVLRLFGSLLSERCSFRPDVT